MWLPGSTTEPFGNGSFGAGFALPSGAIPARQARCSHEHKSCSAHHFELVQGYREERQRQLAVAEEASLGYVAEGLAYTEKHPLITFRDWLIYQRRAE